jgi:Tol biopolymer transport system component
MRNYIYRHPRKISRLGWLTLLSLMLISGNITQDRVLAAQNNTDLLAYSTYEFNGKRPVMLYDPRNDVSTSVIETTGFRQIFLQITFSINGDVAYARTVDDHAEIYISNLLAPSKSPRIIRVNPKANEYPVSWSRDGRYLAFSSHTDDAAKLYIWDGNNAIDITLESDNVMRNFNAGAFAWSLDGRLAFTEWYDQGFPEKGDSSEIYLWDGNSTTSLSQNPTGRDEAPTWSADGRIAFLSARNGEYDIFIWDGVSLKNGSPDIDTYVNVSPELTNYNSYPAWTNDGGIAFGTNGLRYRYVQIYKWYGKTLTNLSQNPELHNGSQTWGIDGRWAFSTYFSSQQLVQVRDADNRTLYSDQGQWPRWSADGYLIFCRYSYGDWSLLIWDGQQTREITRGQEIWAQWQSGATVTCSSG